MSSPGGQQGLGKQIALSENSVYTQIQGFISTFLIEKQKIFDQMFTNPQHICEVKIQMMDPRKWVAIGS
jgi:hypothetical protein